MRTWFLVFILSSSIFAQSPQPSSASERLNATDRLILPTATSHAQALLILQRCQQVMGVPDSLPDTLAKGTVTYLLGGSRSRPLKIETKGASMVRHEIGSPGVDSSVSIISDRKAILRNNAKENPLPHASVRYFRPEHLPAFACRVGNSAHQQIDYLGLEDVNGIPAHHLRMYVRPPGNDGALEELLSDFHVFIDAKTFQVIKTRHFVFSPDAIENHSVWDAYFSDYRSVGGLQLPFRIERFSDNKLHSVVTFDTVQLDAVIDAADFE
jgi:hypothetical protein